MDGRSALGARGGCGAARNSAQYRSRIGLARENGARKDDGDG